ncbi:MAG: DUF4157 domain-containing protein [Spirulinaceae cyanobacterium]
MRSRTHLQKKGFSKSAVKPIQRKLNSLPNTVQAKPQRQSLEEMEISRKNAERLGDHMVDFSQSAPAQPIQTKLTIGEVGDKYEQEADATAAQVVKQINSPGQSGNSVQREALPEEDEAVQMKPESTIQRQPAGGETAAGEELESSIEQSRGNGQPLSDNIRGPMEESFGADFSGVNVHTDSQSDQLNQSIGARAFAMGQDVFFRQGAYDPSSKGGQELIAHELTHVVQQNGGAVQKKGTDTQKGESPALQMRSQLRASSLSKAAIQRKVDTLGGEWDTDKYDLITPANPSGLRGSEIELKFKPGNSVDAELIGLTQSVKSIKSKKPHFINNDIFYKNRAIDSKDAITVDSNTSETDEGTMIDRVKNYNNPIYPVNSLPSKSLDDTSTSPGWGQHGYHYQDKSGELQHQDAILKDAPKLVRAEKESGQIFETTALATKGLQSGTYYGSVRWGWRTDDQGNFTKIPLSKVSDGVPSSTFMKSAELWNASKTSTGADTVDLPVVDVKITKGAVTLTPPAPMQTIALPVGTRLQIIQEWHTPLLNGTVKVIDGPHTGITGKVSPGEWGNIADERA